jgi:hypothetical protein
MFSRLVEIPLAKDLHVASWIHNVIRDESLLRELAEQYLLPLFSGAELLGPSDNSTPGQQCVAYDDPCTIAFKVDRRDTYRLLLFRSQPFAQLASGLVTERDVVDAFVTVVREIAPGLETGYRDDLLSTFQRRVVASAIAPPHTQKVVLGGLINLPVGQHACMREDRFQQRSG